MRAGLALGAAAMLLAGAQSLAAQPAAPQPKAGPHTSAARPASEAEAGEIRAAIEELHRALEAFFTDKKIDPVMRHYDSLVEYFSPSGVREVQKDIRRRLLSHAERVKGFKTQIRPLTVRVAGEIAWATFEVQEQYTFDGQSGEEELISTYVLERKPAGWRIVHEHQSLRLEGQPTP